MTSGKPVLYGRERGEIGNPGSIQLCYVINTPVVSNFILGDLPEPRKKYQHQYKQFGIPFQEVYL